MLKMIGHRFSHGVGPVSQVGILIAGGGYATNAAGQSRLGARGFVMISDVSISNTSLEGVIIEDKPQGGNLSLTFDNVRLNQTANYYPGMLPSNHDSKRLSPIYMGRTAGIITGGIAFTDCTVADDRNRSFLSTGSSATHRARGGLKQVQSSNFTVHNRFPFGCTVELGPGAVDVHVDVSASRCLP